MITIVSGLPRSGTSLMMRMLEAGGLPALTDAIRVADIDNPNGYYEFEPVKQTDQHAAWLDQAEGRAVKLVYKLLETLPDDRLYRVLFMQRRLKEVVASQNRMLERLKGDDPAREAETPDPGDRADNPDGSEHNTDAHRLVGMLASEVAKYRAWLALRPHFQVLYVNYNRLIEDPEAQLPEIVAFCGGGLDAAAMRAVIDPSLYRRRLT